MNHLNHNYHIYPSCLFVCVEVLRPSQPNGVMSSAVSLPKDVNNTIILYVFGLPNHTFSGQAWSSKLLTSTVHILSPETDNCPSWISGRERMTLENISWSNLQERMLPTRRGLNPQPSDHESDAHPTEPPIMLVLQSEQVHCTIVKVNVLKFETVYFILLWPKFCFYEVVS